MREGGGVCAHPEVGGWVGATGWVGGWCSTRAGEAVKKGVWLRGSEVLRD